jgi:hypothetical protein
MPKRSSSDQCFQRADVNRLHRWLRIGGEFWNDGQKCRLRFTASGRRADDQMLFGLWTGHCGLGV